MIQWREVKVKPGFSSRIFRRNSDMFHFLCIFAAKLTFLAKNYKIDNESEFWDIQIVSQFSLYMIFVIFLKMDIVRVIEWIFG